MSENSSRKTAFIFPGQGSQALAMLQDFASESIVNSSFEQASDQLGYDVWQLCQQGPVESLNQTDKTQPALLTASYALWRLWQQRAELPKLVAGHSLGEYSALVCAGILDFEQGVKLVEQRGQFMQQAVAAGVGKMAAIIGLDDALVEQACEQSADGEIVSPVNYNSPGQVVIAGNADAVERAMVACKDKGAKRALPLAVSVPSHCLLMKPASEQLAMALQSIEFKSSDIQLINNVDVKRETDQAAIKDALVRQLYCPVRWSNCVLKLSEMGIENLVECGPGKVLTGLNRRIDRGLNSFCLQQASSFEQAVETLK
ncbi:MAG: ACP S-malonyltransferase [Enterobacterales bacterium]|nr:ACP S-malonyltransferase [Enterobacterales bacterium]